MSDAQSQNFRDSVEQDLPDDLRRTSKDMPRVYAEMRYRKEEEIQKHSRDIQRGASKKSAPAPVSAKKKEIDIDEHLLTVAEMAHTTHPLDYTKSRINPNSPNTSQGLSSAEAQERLNKFGQNKLTPPRPVPAIVKIIKQFIELFPLLLLFGGALCLLAFFLSMGGDGNLQYDNLYLGIILILVVFIQAFFTYFQEAKSSKIMEGFKNMVPVNAVLLRDGQQITLDAKYCVPGDIIRVKSGDKVPADVRILSCNDLKVNNSSLTGESEPQTRAPESSHANPLETANLVFFGSFIANGSGIGVIVRTGDNTVMGNIAKLASSTGNEKTPLRIEIEYFVWVITALALGIGAVFLVLGLALGQGIVTVIVSTIGIIVANVPEGLPLTVTVALTLTSQRMAKKNVLVKNLESVETLGSTTTICSDKTGTLTQNRMTVSHVFYDRAIFKCSTNPAEKGNWRKEDPSFQALQRVASLCSTAVFMPDEANIALPVSMRKVEGDASETALVKFFQPIRDINEYRASFQLQSNIPFNSKNKWQLHIHDMEDSNDKRKLLLMKGAPERVLKMCSKIMIDGEIEDLDAQSKRSIDNAILKLGQMGERVLGFCQHIYPEDDPEIQQFGTNVEKLSVPRNDMVFVGLTAMIDPPREGVKEAVEICGTAGIQVIMVTGDHKVTAHAIAKSIGIIKGKTIEEVAAEKGIDVAQVGEDEYSAYVVTGDDIAKGISQEEWDRILSKREIVFARTSPQQKLKIVSECQARGAVVAVTGDGVNDSPALKKADIGISMGITGTEVSKEAADMILMDDNFASIVNGVNEGRTIFDNIKKAIAYILISNFAQLIPFLVFVTLNIPLALGTIMILCIDLGTDILPAISFSYEPPESDIMMRPPRSKDDHLVNAQMIGWAYMTVGVISTLAGFYAYFVVFAQNSFPPPMLFGAGANHFTLAGSKPIKNMFGETIGEDTQIDILLTAQTAYFLMVVLCKIGNLFMARTRRNSFIQQGLKNSSMSASILAVIALCIVFIYIPGLGLFLQTRPVPFLFWVLPIPFALFELSLEELRKFMIRNEGENGFFEAYTYW
uniref:Sodium/potassium-transporting ATPase subunit alpha n=1 Tax=Percolomonas cosmopolitus TaxID=63605 RepID=A0A7S1PH34_9EUKA